MAEMLAATLALPDAPIIRPGVTLTLAPPAQRLSLRARDLEALIRAAGLKLPSRIGDFADGVAMLGPDEWYAILNPPPLGEVAARRADGEGSTGTPKTMPAAYSVPLHEPPPPTEHHSGAVSIVDVSTRSIGITMTGPHAAEILTAGCPLDLARMAPGRATRTLFETVEIILIRQSEDRFYIDVWRSFAPWLFAALTAASPA